MGIGNIAIFFGLGTQMLYFWFILVALLSMIVISHILINDLYDRQLIRDIVLYLLGVCCCIALILTFAGSVAVPAAVWTSQTFDLILGKEKDLRN